MSLVTNVTDLATRISTEVKALRTLINGNAADLSALTTTAQSNLVAAINEIDAAVGAGSPTTLDDLTDVTLSGPTTAHILRHNGSVWVNVLGTTYFDAAGAAAAAQSASQPVDSDLTSIAALTTTSYGRALLELADQAALMGLVPSSSETVQGKIQLATQAETNTGTDDARAVTPLKFQTRLAAYAQPLDSDLTSIAALTTTSYGRAFLELANQAALVALLPGYQPVDSDLTSIAALTTTSYGRALLELANQAALTAAIANGTESLPGILELATQGETNTGTDDVRAVTPLKFQTRLAAYAQPLDSDLTSIAALTTTSYGRALLELANQGALLTAIGDSSATAKGVVELATDAETITGTDTVRATTPANLAALFTDRIDTSTSLGTSNTKVPSQNAVKVYVDALIGTADAMVFKGVIDASANPNYPAANKGDTYKISVAGKIGGASGPNVEVGDIIISTADGQSAGNHATVGANWAIIQVNVDGAVTGPASAVSGDFATFNGTSGKIIQDSGLSLTTSTSLGTSDVLIPSQNAVKVYADTKQGLDATLTALAGVTTAADKLIYATGSDAFTTTDLSSYARTLLDDTDAATARGTLSVYSQAQIGDPTTNFVTTFEAGLV